MRILLVLHECPYPADTGPRNHSLGLLRIAAQLGECDVVGFSRDEAEAARWRELHAALPGVRIRELLPVAAGIRAAWGGVQCLTDRFPISARPYFRSGLSRRLKRLAHSGRYDLVHVDSFRLCRLTSQLRDLPTVLIPPDAFSMSFQRALSNCRTWDVYLRCLARYKTFSNIERKYFPRHSVVCPVSPLDAAWLRQHVPDANVREVPIPIADEFFQHEPERHASSADPHIIIAGSFIEDCVTQDTVDVIDQCLPAIRRAVPKVRVTVWGRVRSDALRSCLERSSHVDHVSWVDDYRAMLRSAWVYLYPQSAMSGIQTKVQQAMAMGLPVVGRSASLQPLRVKSGRHAFVADDNRALSEAVIRLLDNRSLRQAIGQGGHELMQQQFSSSAVAQRLQAAYQAAITPATVSEVSSIPLVPAYVD